MNERVGTIRASSSTLTIFGGIWLLIFFLPGLYIVWRGQWTGAIPIVLGAALTIGPMLRYRVSWDEEGLAYRGLGLATRIRWSDIGAYKIGGASLRNVPDSVVGLRVISKTSGATAMVINIKPFSRRDVSRLTELLDARVDRTSTASGSHSCDA